MPAKRTSKTKEIDDAKRNKALADSAASIKAWLAQLVTVSGDLKIGKKPLQHFWLSPAHRDVLVLVPGVSKAIKKKLGNERSSYSVAEVASMTTAVAEDLRDGQPSKQAAVLIVAMHLMDRLKEGIVGTAEPKTTKGKQSSSKSLYQFKITLLESHPPIWRRIQVENCTLEKLHEHIQTAMGWTNSHLHQFDIKGERYGDPELLDEGVGDQDIEDSTTTMMSEILPKSGKRFRFVYEYDFGDGWQHEVLFEGCPEPEKGKKYPLCLEGERACPPEDIGGVGGYENFLEVIADPQHEEHADMREWIGDKFDAERFDAKAATKAMKKGLQDWRNEDEDF